MCEWTGCEWKTRYEMQVEMNQMLEMQIALLNEKADEMKKATKDGKGFLCWIFPNLPRNV